MGGIKKSNTRKKKILGGGLKTKKVKRKRTYKKKRGKPKKD